MVVFPSHLGRALMVKQAAFGSLCGRRSSNLLGKIRANPTTGLQQSRLITSYIRDVIRTRSLNPGNPLVKALDSSKPEEYLRCVPLIEADHVKDAIRHVKAQQAAIQARHATVFSSTAAQEKDKSDESSSIQTVVQAVNDMEAPAHRLRQLCAIMLHCGRAASDSVEHQLWQNATGSVCSEFPPFQCVTSIPMQQMRMIGSHVPSEDDKEMAFAARLLILKHQVLTGVRDISKDGFDDEDATRYREFSGMLTDIEESLLSTKSMSVSPTRVSDVYNFVGIRREQAKLLGYGTVMDQTFCQSRVTTLKEIEAIHDAIEQEILPRVRALTGSKSRAEREMESYLSPTSPVDSAMSMKQTEAKKDKFYMMKLEKYITLEGALQFMFQFLNSLSGVSFRPIDAQNGSIDKHTLVFGAYDGDEHLGTLVIDPLQKSEALHQAVSIPLVAKSATALPLVCLSLSIQPPTWDKDPIRLTWDDCESLFHEMGHCLQMLCGKSELGCVLGPEMLPGDTSEFLPKFMEHWLTEESTIHTMVNLSKCDEPFEAEALETAFRVRSRTKTLKLAEQAFRSSLEVAIFSDFDLKGSETVMDLQSRIADKFIPHADVEDNNLEPIVSMLKSVIARRQADQYRYIWSDCVSASVFKRLKESYGTNPESAMEDFKDTLRKVVLHPGSTADFGDLLKRYKESEVSVTADLFELSKFDSL